MTDTDDSIVLDDLVRTGEASRLRRRGALRLDHHHHHSHPPALLSWDYDDDDEEDEDEGEDYIPPGLRHIRRPAVDYKYSLFCGGDVSSPAESNAFTPSILPLAPSSGPSLPPPPKQRSTNGCGTLLHAAAAPRRWPSSAAHTWHALSGSAASPVLVPLDPAYIDDPAPLHIHRASCGCVREAFACAVCGNLLGTRCAPCPIDVHSSSLSAADSYSYTFFDTAVSSSPAYSYSPPSPPSPRAATVTTPPPLIDRFITASPTPLTDEERTAYYRARPTWSSGSGIGYSYAQLRSSLRYGGIGARTAAPSERVHDPDAAEADGDEAASDKTAEGVFLPER